MIKTIVRCDVCGREVELKTTPVSEEELSRALADIGWVRRDDAFPEVCDRHPEVMPSKVVRA